MTSKDLVAWGKVLVGNWLAQQAMRLDSVRVAIFFLGRVYWFTDYGRPSNVRFFVESGRLVATTMDDWRGTRMQLEGESTSRRTCRAVALSSLSIIVCRQFATDVFTATESESTG